MKRYWLFSFDTYYPLGGFEDFKGSFDSIEECHEKHRKTDYVNGHVFDSDDKKVIHQYYKSLAIHEVYGNDNFDARFPELQEVFQKEVL